MSTVHGYNIVILPSAPIKKKAILWSKQMATTVPTKFVLDGIQYHPHMTLYQSNFPDENYPALISALHDQAKKITPFSISFEKINTYVDFIFLYALRTKQLQTTHEAILHAIHPLHDPNYTVPKDLQGFPPTIAKNINEYGCGLVNEDFLPHITLSRCNSTNEAERAALSPTFQLMVMEVRSFSLTNVDHDGTCTKIIETFPLQG